MTDDRVDERQQAVGDDGWDLADELYKHGEELGLSPVAAQVIAKAVLDSGVVVPTAELDAAREANAEMSQANGRLRGQEEQARYALAAAERAREEAEHRLERLSNAFDEAIAVARVAKERAARKLAAAESRAEEAEGYVARLRKALHNEGHGESGGLHRGDRVYVQAQTCEGCQVLALARESSPTETDWRCGKCGALESRGGCDHEFEQDYEEVPSSPTETGE